MPPLSNPKHERFAQELAKGASPEKAYETAGYKPARQNAHRMMTNDDILMRVQEIQGRAAVRAEVTVASLIDEAEEVRAQALKDGQYSAAIAAIREKGVLAGVRVEKRENRNTVDPNKMSDDELAAIASAGSAGVVAPSTHKGITH